MPKIAENPVSVRTTDDFFGSRTSAKPGIVCPKCHERVHAVIDSRPGVFSGTGTTRRLRKCSSCDHRWATHEISARFRPGDGRSAELEAELGELRCLTDRLAQLVSVLEEL